MNHGNLTSKNILRSKIPTRGFKGAPMNKSDDSSGHDLAKLVQDGVQWEDTSEVKAQSNDNGGVERSQSVTEVWQLLALQVNQWLTLGPDTRPDVVEGKLNSEESKEVLPDGQRRNTVIQEQFQQMQDEVTE
ncbi:hypothetical protein WICPIJ_008251 [Wickerhamomyces pijperi]|uniref:Uncharacterized protein n=1 Tax=Wickerhamomyces pijperi TaxID=599730 RepID=A0A9P8TI81_WICPI|nr:hypothetical protein WICPIJ_008251 [Wickerhamomyces pijperi]